MLLNLFHVADLHNKMAPGKSERRKRGRWEQYNADFNADENSQSSNLGERSNSGDKDATGFFF